MHDIEKCTILVVDDEEANLALLEMVLRPVGYERIVRVADAREVMTAFERSRPDIVLLDLHMPHRSGFETLADIRARVPASEFLPVLVLTADTTRDARERALAEGAHDFVLKPFDRTEVRLRVRNLLRTRVLHEEHRRARDAAEAAAARDRILADAGRIAAASLDSRTVLAGLTARLVEAWADEARVIAHPDGGEAMVVTARSDAAGARDVGSDRTLRVALELPDAEAWLVLERAEGRPPFDDHDRALALEVARRAALALENARLYGAAQEAVAARDRTLAVVAHDLRSPLTAVRFDVEMLRVDSAPAMSAHDAATLARVERAVLHMDELIEDLLDVSRLERGPLALECEPHDMGALLAGTAASLRSLVEGQGVRFTVRADDDVGVLKVDRRRMVQAISNLVGNAAKFASAGGEVSLRWARADGELRVAVRDDGAGIPPEELQHIFGAFWQARHADRRGLGLGLAIARGIVEAHGGRIWVESTVGAGSTFLIALPAA